MTTEKFVEVLDRLDTPHEVQLEGGEPTAHPDFAEFLSIAEQHPMAVSLILNTNAAIWPADRNKLYQVLEQLPKPTLLKISYNHYLRDHDSQLLQKLKHIAQFCRKHSDTDLVVNLRRRPDGPDQDHELLLELESCILLEFTNDFFLQSYGRASDQHSWSAPFAVKSNFDMYNPDGEKFRSDLVKRSEAMKELG